MHVAPCALLRLSIVASALSAPAASAQVPITRASVRSNGAEGNGSSGMDNNVIRRPSISADGRFVAFESAATNLVSNDHNGYVDIFVHDRIAGTTVRVSVDSSGNESDGDSRESALSQDGRFVAFTSDATDLVASDGNGVGDVFVHDRDPDGNGVFDEGNGVTTRVSVNSNGVEGKRGGYGAAISADGNRVAFTSWSANLVLDTNGYSDVFVHDRATATTIRASVASDGTEANWESEDATISGDGNVVAFTSHATNLVAGDTNSRSDAFVHDLSTGATIRVSVDTNGVQGNDYSALPCLNGDGSIVGFSSLSDNLDPNDTNQRWDVFVHDRVGGTTSRISVGPAGIKADSDSWSGPGSMSADGRTVAFESYATNLDPKDWNGTMDVFVHDVVSGITTVASFNCCDAPGDSFSGRPSLSADGTVVTFTSYAKNLVARDLNGVYDIFVHDLTIADPVASWSNYGAGFPGTNGIPALTASADPVLGTSISIDVGNSSGAPATGWLVIGFQQTTLHTGLGGDLLVVPAILQPIVLSAGGVSIPGALPLDPAWCGVHLELQAIESDPGAAKGASFTPGLELVFGD